MTGGELEWEAVNIAPDAAHALATRTSKDVEEVNDCLRDALQWSTELGDEGGALRSAATAANAALKPCLDPSCILQPGAASSFRARLRPLRARSNVALAVSQLDKVSRQATEAATHAGTLTLGGQALRLGTLAGLALLRRERCQYGGRLAAEVRARREARRDSAFARVVAEIQREGGTLFRRLAAALERWARGSEEEGTVKAVRFSAGLLERALLHEKGDYRAAEAADYIIKFAKQFGDVIEDFIEQCCLPAEKTLEELGLVGRAGCLSAAGTELCVGNLRLARDFAFEGLKMQRESEGSMALKRASGRMYKQRFERYLCMLLAGLPKVYGYLTSNYAELGDAKLLYKLAPEVADTVRFVRVSVDEARLSQFVAQQEAAAAAFRSQHAEQMAEALRRLGQDKQVEYLWTAVRFITPHMPPQGRQQLQQLADRAQQAREAIPCRLRVDAQGEAQPHYFPPIRTVDSATDMQQA